MAAAERHIDRLPRLVAWEVRNRHHFFFHYARFTGEELFDEYAWDLVVAMQEQLHANYRPDYEWGIAGIGVGIDYLIRSGLIEVDEDFFEDLDERMYRAVMYDPYPDYSRDEGLTGYGWYWLCRRANAGAADCLSRIAARIEQDQAGFSPGEIRDAARFPARLCRASGSG